MRANFAFSLRVRVCGEGYFVWRHCGVMCMRAALQLGVLEITVLGFRVFRVLPKTGNQKGNIVVVTLGCRREFLFDLFVRK